MNKDHQLTGNKLPPGSPANNSLVHTILNGAPDAVITIDISDTILSWNAQAEIIFGWKENEVLGNKLTKTIIPERYHEGHLRGMQHFLKTGEAPVLNKPIEVTALRKDKTEFYAELKVSSALTEGNHIFIGFVRDISVRKEAEEIIKNKSAQLAEAQQMAHIGSWEWDIQKNKIEWSDELYHIFGQTPGDFDTTFENYLSLIHPDDREKLEQTLHRAFQDKCPYDIVHRIKKPDSSIRFISGKGKVISDSEGMPVRMAGTAQDITAQKKYETELKESEERFVKIFNRNPVPMMLAEVKTNTITFANDLFYDTFGYSREEVIGNTAEGLKLMDTVEYKRVIDKIMHLLGEKRNIKELMALSPDETEDLLNRLKQTEEMKNFEILYTRKNGEKFPALVSYETMRLGAKSFTITSYLDITERRKTEIQLKKQNEQLEKINSELESFAYVSSHDLQEPLRKIQTYASLITDKEYDKLSERGKEYLDRMSKAAQRMRNLIEDLLAFSRTNRDDRVFEMTDLNTIAQQVKEDLQEELMQKNAVLEIGDMCSLSVIPFQMRQLLHNLISNSLKFSMPDTIPHILVNCVKGTGINFENPNLKPHDTYWRLCVADNGIGFDQHYSSKIFEVFQRLHAKESLPGTGIGLAIVKKIVDNHDGDITAKGETGNGATFDVFIPAG